VWRLKDVFGGRTPALTLTLSQRERGGNCLDSAHTLYNLTWEEMHEFLTL